MHFLIGRRQRFQIVRPHPVQFQLESTGGLQMPVDPVFLKAVPVSVREKFRELLVLQSAERYASDAAVLQFFLVAGAPAAEYLAHRRVVGVAFIFYAHVQDVDRFLHAVFFSNCPVEKKFLTNKITIKSCY